MGTECQEVLCDEHGFSGDCEYCGDNDAKLGRINVFYHASRSKHMGLANACRKRAPASI
jgi:hypothetical protein